MEVSSCSSDKMTDQNITEAVSVSNVDAQEIQAEVLLCTGDSLLVEDSQAGETIDSETEKKEEGKKYESTDSLNSKKELSTSEFNLRASAIRAQVEEKIKEIEAKLWPENGNEDVKTVSKLTLSSSEENLCASDERRARSSSMFEIKQMGVARLQKDLDQAQKDLASMDLEVHKLSKLRDEVGAEIEDLTASLFEEATKMVNEANVKREIAQKRANEANMKFAVLQDEVRALKGMVESLSYFSGASQNMRSSQAPAAESTCTSISQRENYEVDPVFHHEFVTWRQNPNFDKAHAFFRRIYAEDVNSCMCFKNKKLADKVLSAIEKEKIVIEMLTSKKSLPKKCDLLDAPRFCTYKMNIGDETDYYISALSRNRVAAVCELFCYLRYIEKGLIKQSIHEVYLEILKKRRNITTAKLGLIEEF